MLFVSNSVVAKILNEKDNFYRVFQRPDAKGKVRTYEEPINTLKKIQSRLNDLLMCIETPGYLHGPKRKRSNITNAIAHSSGLEAITVDIKSFFPNVRPKNVYYFFKDKLQCSEDIAQILTELCTFNNHLPTGGSTSPVLSHFAFIDMWDEMDRLARSNNHLFTVYVDDMTISGEFMPPKYRWQVDQILRKYGLKAHNKKKRLFRNGQPKDITGAIVKNNRLYAPHRVHLNKSRLTKQPSVENKLLGVCRYIHAVEEANKP